MLRKVVMRYQGASGILEYFGTPLFSFSGEQLGGLLPFLKAFGLFEPDNNGEKVFNNSIHFSKSII